MMCQKTPPAKKLSKNLSNNQRDASVHFLILRQMDPEMDPEKRKLKKGALRTSIARQELVQGCGTAILKLDLLNAQLVMYPAEEPTVG